MSNISVLKTNRIDLGVLGDLAVQLYLSCSLQLVATFAFSAAHSHPSAKPTMPIVQRRSSPSHPLHLCHFSGISRANRHVKVSIQRITPSLPPIISAGIMQNLQQICIFCIRPKAKY